MVENTGSFGAAIGGGEALKAAMARRGMDASVLDQVSPAAPTGASAVPPPVPQSSPNMGAAMATTTPEQPKATARSAEMEIALKALADTVKTENKIAESSLGTMGTM